MVERIGIIGGGIVGIAVARALSSSGDFEVTVLEKEARLAAHQTGHNSGVVHAGLYYQPGSLKAELCSRGREMTRDYCLERGLPYREVGKLVVALSEDELGRLDDIQQRASTNQVPGLRRLSAEEMREVEPNVAGVAAVHSPHTAVVDYAAITECMAGDVRANGGSILLHQEVTAISTTGGVTTVSTTSGTHTFDRLLVCAGLQSDILAKMVGASPSPKILPFRGEYWSMSAESAPMIKGMIYPVPDPRFPFLGVHFTRGVYDDVHVGPNAVPALAREGYSWGKISFKDTFESLAWPGAGVLAKNHWLMGVREVSASLLKPLYYKQAQSFVPALKSSHLESKTAAGVRAQAWNKDGSLLDDFAVDQVGSVTLLRNAPSPAATSAMAIADYVLKNFMKIATR
ncbi:L-2-hydroxyglutarate oxidase [Paeniglutamicibacter sp.]|uniref:L-2-hydroxyglutarate oxidase n=1 Tax=Paeniglutamicibacter sp. TaxID=1934391 RepID=UPI0039893F54